MSRDEGFLSRWSRRKRESRQGDAGADPEARGDDPAHRGAPPSSDDVREPAARDAGGVDAGASAAPGAPSSSGAAAASAPSTRDASASDAERRPVELPAIDSLTPRSDFRPFMQAGVDAATRNAALAKLFADPHFSVMDGLDVYIDDYNQTEPIPPAMLAKLKQLHAIGLSDEEIERWSREGEAATRIAQADASPRADAASEPRPADRMRAADEARTMDERRGVDETPAIDDAQAIDASAVDPVSRMPPSGSSDPPIPHGPIPSARRDGAASDTDTEEPER